MIKRKKIIISALIAASITNLVPVSAMAYGDVSNAILDTSLSSNENKVSILESSGWLESASVEWEAVEGATGYNVYYKLATALDSEYKRIDDELIRRYPDNFRADLLGLKEGNYVIKIVPITNGEAATSAQAITKSIQVVEHTREGFAFSKESTMKTASGGYNDDGTVAEDAQIIYITAENVNTVQAEVITNSKGTKKTITGLVNILSNRGKGYDKRPLIIRMIGQINGSDIDGLNSNGYIQIKGCYNVTFEGVGEDATVYGWGFLIRNSKNVELRNLGVMMFPDDAISLDTGNENIWVHNNDIFYGAAGSDADQVKGDGSADVKGKSTYVTLSYNHFYDSGKVSLCGMSDTEEFFVTYHHNWFDHSDSRHPRIRVGTVHIYNNYFDGNSKYGVGVTKGSSAFVEANDFRNSKYPMLSSLQGSDIAGGNKGNFSGEAGGMIKAYNNKIVGAKSLVYANDNSKQFDAYLASSRYEKVSSSYKTVSGGNTYNNFDTASTMYKYTPDDVEDVKSTVTTYAGRINGGDFNWVFTDSDDTSYSVNKELMDAIKNYKSKLIYVGGNGIDVVLPEVPVEPEIPVEPEQPEQPEEQVTAIHNFTTDNINSDFFKIKGNLSSSKGSVNYNDLTLTKCLKIESSTFINFTTTTKSTVTLVFSSNFNKSILIDGIKYSAKDGIINVELEAGDHSITKEDVANLYYIKVQ